VRLRPALRTRGLGLARAHQVHLREGTRALNFDSCAAGCASVRITLSC
jgi:hypothetical protein